MIEDIKEVLKTIIPDEEEVKKAKLAEEILRERLDSLKLEYKFVGSYARNTWLRGNLEIDVFVLFPKEMSKKELKTKIIEIGKKVLDKVEIRYAEHPYVHGSILDVEIDLVPCYKVESPERIISAVDRTPFHHEWLKDRIKGKENEIRLLKQFLKANGLYGAEYKVRGFSGYLCELLIVFYGSFAECIRNAAFWNRRTVIDVKRGEVREGESFFVVDPVDENRNVAANLSLDNLAKFVHLARLYLKNPSVEFFVPRSKKIGVDKILHAMQIRDTAIFSVEFEKPEIVEDNLYPQLERASKKIFEALKREGFMPLRSSFFASNKCYLLFECQIKEISRISRKIGPFFEDFENSEKFLTKERDFEPFIEDGRWWAYEYRRFRKPEEMVSDFIKKNYQALGKNIGIELSRGFRILKGQELLIPELVEKLAEFLGVKG